MANTLPTIKVWGCTHAMHRTAFQLMLELYALPAFNTVDRSLIYAHYRAFVDSSSPELYQYSMERFTGVTILDAEPGSPETGYYSKLSPIFQQLNLCMGTGECLQDDPYTEPLNFVNAPSQIPPP